MEQPTRGRHRRAPSRRSLPLTAAVVGAVGLVALAVTATAVLTDGGDVPTESAAPTATATVTESAVPTATATAISGTRDVRVRRGVVTVVEELTVVDGDDVVVTPARRSTDSALQLTAVRLLAEDGTADAFDEPVALGADRSLTVQGTYRLRSCPDLLPVSWPSPTAFRGDGWSRTWTRTSEPLRTAATLCPNAPPRARPLPGLSARLLGGEPGSPPVARIALTWAGTPGRVRLVVDRVGSLGGLAAEAPLAADTPCPVRGCVLALRSGTSSARGVLPVQPVESCPDSRPRTSRLTLVAWTDLGRAQPRLVALSVPGLGRWVDRHICR